MSIMYEDFKNCTVVWIADVHTIAPSAIQRMVSMSNIECPDSDVIQ